MKNTAYPVIFEKEKDGYFVTVPDLNKNTQGEDLADAIAMARDLICLWIVDLEDEGKPVPAPGSVKFTLPVGAFVSFVDVFFANFAGSLIGKSKRIKGEHHGKLCIAL